MNEATRQENELKKHKLLQLMQVVNIFESRILSNVKLDKISNDTMSSMKFTLGKRKEKHPAQWKSQYYAKQTENPNQIQL